MDTLSGVQSVAVNRHQVAVDYDTTGTDRERIKKEIEKRGYVVTNIRTDGHGQA
ncbi:MAG TPA: hypothetical protein GXZ52_04985 [Clostridiales bacterium]|nr:hypothetical protein [Clostridiales bacterium]